MFCVSLPSNQSVTNSGLLQGPCCNAESNFERDFLFVIAVVVVMIVVMTVVMIVIIIFFFVTIIVTVALKMKEVARPGLDTSLKARAQNGRM